MLSTKHKENEVNKKNQETGNARTASWAETNCAESAIRYSDHHQVQKNLVTNETVKTSLMVVLSGILTSHWLGHIVVYADRKTTGPWGGRIWVSSKRKKCSFGNPPQLRPTRRGGPEYWWALWNAAPSKKKGAAMQIWPSFLNAKFKVGVCFKVWV